MGDKLSAEDKVLYVYGSLVNLSLISVDEAKFSVKIVTPDLAGLYIKHAKTEADVEKMHMAVAKDLETGTYNELSKAVTLTYEITSDTTISIEENEEYLNTIYGGLLDAYSEIYKENNG